MTTNDGTTAIEPDPLPGVANLEPPKDLFTADPEPSEKSDADKKTDDGDKADGTDKAENSAASSTRNDSETTKNEVVTEAAPRPAHIADHANWRDVEDNPWQADEDAPPPVIGY